MISLRDVTLRYGARDERAALSSATLDIAPGLTLLLGPNGAGKSTLLKIIAGVEQPATGTVAIDGHDLWRDEVVARSALTYVPEHPDLSPYATVREILALVCELRGEPMSQAEVALDRLGMGDVAHRTVRELSMGQRRRAVLASAFIGRVHTILLDEPLETLDRALRDDLVAWVHDKLADGATIVISTHEIEPFVVAARRVVRVVGGRVDLIEPLPTEMAARLAVIESAARGSATIAR